MPNEAVGLWLDAADVLGLPGRQEGCPKVVLEALACGTPVAAFAFGAVADLLDETSGATAAPCDPGALAGAIVRALRRPWDRNALCKRVEGMSWEQNAFALWRILSSVCSAAIPATAGRPW